MEYTSPNRFHISVLVDQANLKQNTASLIDQIKHINRFIEDCITLEIRIFTIYLYAANQWLNEKDNLSFQNTVIENLISLTEFCEFHGIQFKRLGISLNLPVTVLDALEKAEKRTHDNNKYLLHLFLNYGDREEIVEASKRIIEDGVLAEKVDVKTLIKYLYPFDASAPNLLLDTTNIDNPAPSFIMWNSPETIQFHTQVNWNDISIDILSEALQYYRQMNKLTSLTRIRTNSSSN